MAAAKKSSPVRTGVDPRKGRKDGGSTAEANGWLKIEAGSHVDATVLVEADDIIVGEQCAIWMDDGSSPIWIYSGADDPSHDLGVERRYRAFIPLLTEEGVKVWSMGKTAHIAFLDIADASGSLLGLEVRIKRTGTALATRYSIVPRGKRRDVSSVEEVDIPAMLGPLDSDGARDLIAEKLGKDSYEDVLDAYRGRKAPTSRGGAAPAPKPAKAKKPVAPVIEEDEEEDDEEDLELA